MSVREGRREGGDKGLLTPSRCGRAMTLMGSREGRGEGGDKGLLTPGKCVGL